MSKTENGAQKGEGQATNKSSWQLLQKLFRKLKPGTDIHRDDLMEGLHDKDNAHADSFNEDEKKFLKNILFLRSRHVEDVMVRRAQISALDVDSSMENIQKTFERTSHSRLPVYRGTLDFPLGILHIKDVFKFLSQKKTEIALEKIIHPPLFVPPSMKAADLLNKMQEQRLHMALVIDEHGGTTGLVSIEDLVEEIVGEIEDEHAPDNRKNRKFVRRRDGSFEIKADMMLTELESILGKKVVEDDKNAQTVGGLTVALFGKVPEKGERVAINNEIIIEVRSANLRSVQQLRVYPKV